MQKFYFLWIPAKFLFPADSCKNLKPCENLNSCGNPADPQESAGILRKNYFFAPHCGCEKNKNMAALRLRRSRSKCTAESAGNSCGAAYTNYKLIIHLNILEIKFN